MTLFVAEPALFTGLVFLLGLLVGSFLNVVVHRLPKMMDAEWQAQCAELRGEPSPAGPRFNLWAPRSACPACGHAITALENVPLLSWLWLRGRCASCRTPISARYPLVELLAALLSAAVAWKWGPTVQAAGALLLVWMLIALAFIDLDTTLLPDSLTLPLLWAGLLINLGGHFASLPDAVAGAAAGYLVLWSVYWMFKLVTGKEGMGYGDFKLLAAIGAWLGWQLLPVTLLLASVVGAVVGITMIVAVKHDRRVPIPFGPYLAGGGLVALFFGADLTQAYLAQF
ncbi:prepilin cysteine protease (C20) PilD [Thiobacillus denitrificans ATCC 25259]|uniref:Prepilin leader peptidase/N-methyltransferase n=1 Tax=Thiobacillus denitrificans (strain ATCC 25259 / T1) TaxID=292415 RepID=Q3SGC9_THIDA|nr:A24 family peptidase [Thiobacillus denitrificans]AAZ98321.1 prepilin cysteine protease (C20) PilD [Thiobacillus denitrificans ATCC 25259]